MKKTFLLSLVISFSALFAGCPHERPPSFAQCKIKGFTLINAEPEKNLNGKPIREFAPVPPKITLKLGELPTRRVMFLINFDPADCAEAIDGTVAIDGGGKSALSKNSKPFVLLGFVMTGSLADYKYTAGEMEPGASTYELTPRFLKNAELADGEKLRFALEVSE
jgi:hypothetical protein